MLNPRICTLQTSTPLKSHLKSWHVPSRISLFYVQQMVWYTCREEAEHKVFLPFTGDVYCRLIIESGGCLEVVTTTQVSEGSIWAKQPAFRFRLGNRSEKSAEFLMGRQDSMSKANKQCCLFPLLIVCYGGQGPPPETVDHHSCCRWAGWHTYCGRLAS